MGIVTRQENKNKTRTKKLENGKFMGMKSFENGNITRKKKQREWKIPVNIFVTGSHGNIRNIFTRPCCGLQGTAAKVTGRR